MSGAICTSRSGVTVSGLIDWPVNAAAMSMVRPLGAVSRNRRSPAEPTARPVVRAVNRILDAAGDPLGAADWWLGGNGRLGGAPARLLGTVPDERLIDAARAGTGEA